MKKAMELRKIDWAEYSYLCRLIAERVRTDYKPEEIVGIARGGVIVGATIASLLKIDFFPIKFSRKINDNVVRKHPKMMVAPTAHLQEKRVLVLDDWSRSGETIRAAIKEINRFNPVEVKSAVLVRAGQFQPDYYATYSTGPVVFPWEDEPHPPQEADE